MYQYVESSFPPNLSLRSKISRGNFTFLREHVQAYMYTCIHTYMYTYIQNTYLHSIVQRRFPFVGIVLCFTFFLTKCRTCFAHTHQPYHDEQKELLLLKFSKVSSIVIWYIKIRSKLTFENIYRQTAEVGLKKLPLFFRTFEGLFWIHLPSSYDSICWRTNSYVPVMSFALRQVL